MENFKYQTLKALTKVIQADLKDWSGRWVHYSKEPIMKINPKQMHADPAGIYFFPEEFIDEGYWEETYPYKFTAEFPSGLSVLDLANASREEMILMVEKALSYKNQALDEETKEKIMTGDDYQRIAWKTVWHRLMTDQAKWNKALRDSGYDAVFDDTRSIHPSEVQLILLDPRKAKVLDMTKKSGSGFKELKKVVRYLEDKFSKYGDLKIEPPKKRKGLYESQKKLNSKIYIEQGDREAELIIEPDFPRGVIGIHLNYSSPRLGHGSGGSYSLKKKTYDLQSLERDLDEIFKKEK